MAAKKLILCDTNVLISAFREEESMLAEFDRLGFGRCGLASVTVAEIYFGMRKSEKRKTLELVRRFKMVHFDKAVSLRILRFQFDFMNRMSIPDSIVGATAIEYDFQLWTNNRQDFDFLPGVRFYNPAG